MACILVRLSEFTSVHSVYVCLLSDRSYDAFPDYHSVLRETTTKKGKNFKTMQTFLALDFSTCWIHTYSLSSCSALKLQNPAGFILNLIQI